MGRIARTLDLARSSWAVLRADKELVALPVLSALASVVVATSFLVPLFLTTPAGTSSLDVTHYVLLAVMYGALAYVTIFFNAALIHAANERMDGGDPTLGSALRGAASRAGRILPWAVISATVSIILRTLEDRGGAVGRIAAGLTGLAWSVVTFLVLPILVMEDVTVGDAIKESGAMLRRTWGENIAAQVGFGLLGFLAALPAVAMVALVAGIGGSGAASGTVIAIAVLWLIAVAVVVATLSGIFQTALYRYARHGDAGAFDPATLSHAFAPKQGAPGRGTGFTR